MPLINISEESIQKIENDMEQLRQSMFLLNDLVVEQGEDLTTLEDYVEVARNNVHQGHQELQDVTPPHSWYIRAGLLGLFIYFLL